jgi:hypothetical protein
MTPDDGVTQNEGNAHNPHSASGDLHHDSHALVAGSARTAQILTLAGAIPFVVCAFALLVPTLAPEWRKLFSQGIITYAAIIISFLGGIQWGIGVATIDQQPRTARSLFLLSVVPSLLAWALLFLPAANTGGMRVIVATMLVAFVWVIDALLHVQRVIPKWFFRLRSVISPIVMASLLLTLFAIP